MRRTSVRTRVRTRAEMISEGGWYANGGHRRCVRGACVSAFTQCMSERAFLRQFPCHFLREVRGKPPRNDSILHQRASDNLRTQHGSHARDLSALSVSHRRCPGEQAPMPCSSLHIHRITSRFPTRTIPASAALRARAKTSELRSFFLAWAGPAQGLALNEGARRLRVRPPRW